MMQWFCEPMLWKPRGVSVKPSCRKPVAAASRSRTATTAWSIAKDSGKRLEKALWRLVADDAQLRHLSALRIEEDDAGRTEKREALQQFAVGRRRRGDVGLQEHHAVKRRAHACVGQGVLLHLLARDAPVGIEIEHYRPSGGAQPVLELGERMHRRPRRRLPRACFVSKACQRLQGIAAAGAGTDH